MDQIRDLGDGIILCLKNEGELLSEIIERIRQTFIIPKEVPITYAGRLDPMAKGLMILLVGDKVHEKENFLMLEKTYEVEILFGVSSDTQDALGIISGENKIPSKEDAEIAIKNFPREYEQEYPKYSSKTVAGTPLFSYARKNLEVELPRHKVHISDIKINGSKILLGGNLSSEAVRRVEKIAGDFRQKEVTESWKNFKEKYGEKEFLILNVVVRAQGGTYMRTLARDIARSIGSDAIAWRIVRIKIGEYFL